MHLVRGCHLFCRNENTVSLKASCNNGYILAKYNLKNINIEDNLLRIEVEPIPVLLGFRFLFGYGISVSSVRYFECKINFIFAFPYLWYSV